MSIEIMTAVINSSVGPAMNRYVLVMLANNANAEGICWPSVETIARNTQLSERTVRRAIRDLEQAALITTRQRLGRSTIFRIHVDRLPRCDAPSEVKPRGIGREVRPDDDTPATVTVLSLGQGGLDDSTDAVTALSSATDRADTRTNRGDTQTPRTVNNPQGTVKSSLRSERAPAKQKRGTRIPDDFELTDAMKQWARTNCPKLLAQPPVNGKGPGQNEFDIFKDYWSSEDGRNTVKRDWVKAWQVWMRRTEQRLGRQGVTANGYRPSTTDSRVQAGLDLARRYAEEDGS